MPGDAPAAEGAGADSGVEVARVIVPRECGAEPFAADVPIVPGSYCEFPMPGRPIECRSGIECLGPWDCEPRAFARCFGVSDMRCLYPGVDAGMASDTQPCESDAACTQAPRGRCTRLITHSTCQYVAECERDEDCGPNARCACGLSGDLVCVTAQCWHDSDCAARQRCRRDYACGWLVGGFFCTRAEDECRDDDDCAPGRCEFEEDAGAWRCANTPPCTIP